MKRISILTTALLTLAQPAIAQSIDGVWVGRESVRIRDSTGTVRDAELTLHFDLAQRGDSVHGAVWTGAIAGFPESPRRPIAGTLREGRLLLQEASEGRVGSITSGDVSMRMVKIYDLLVDGGSLRGTEFVRSLDGAFSAPAKPFVATRATPDGAVSPDEVAVERAVADYVDALYEVRPELIERSVHPNLAKRGFVMRDGEYREVTMTYDQLHALASQWNAAGRVDPQTAVKEIVVLDVLDQTASAKLVAAWGVDYLQLARYGGQWKIVNVLWQVPPQRSE